MMTSTSLPAGLSSWETDLLEHLTHHLETEADLLAEYRKLGESAEAPYVAYLIDLIVEDEQRHHRLFAELVNALRAPAERVTGAQVPTVTSVENPSALLDATEAFLRAERADARELKRVSRIEGLRSMRGLSVWPLLIELMQHDSEKHQAILRFIRKQVRSQS